MQFGYIPVERQFFSQPIGGFSFAFLTPTKVGAGETATLYKNDVWP
jgi:hypothetical protein